MIDERILKFFESLRNPILDGFFIVITDLGSFEFYLLAVSFLFFAFENKVSLKIIFILFISFSLNTLIKNILKLPRPQEGIFNPIYEKSIGTEEYGFPSGHAQNAFVFWFSLYKIFKNKILLFISILVVLLISISRLYLSLHFVLDIIGGVFIGFLIIFFFFKNINVLIDSFIKEKFSFLIPILIFMFSFFMKKYSNLLSPFSGLLLGVLIYKENKNNLNHKNLILRELIGLTTLIFLIYISYSLKNIFILNIIYLISGLWVSYLSKTLFQKIKI